MALSERDVQNKMHTMTEQTGMWSRFKTAVMQPSLSQQNLTVTKQEVAGLEEMGRQLFLEIVDLNSTLERIDYSKTFRGRYFNILGYFFSIYCLWKIFIVNPVFFFCSCPFFVV